MILTQEQYFWILPAFLRQILHLLALPFLLV